ncbi:MAG: response regulator [Candidatus Doudnabacteria bacterium]|nr:response regulator [Candidatus Doudnabacteria bacterium]
MKHIILMVDDDTLILNTLKKRFENWDTQVYAADTPEQAKKILKDVTPEIIILDLLLTKDDGSTGVLDYLRTEPRLQNIPVLVLTNLDKPELKQMLLSQGVKEYLIKGSMTLDDLYNKVISYLEPKN